MNFPKPVLARAVDVLNYGRHVVHPPFSAPIPVACADASSRSLNICSRCLTNHLSPRSLEIHLGRCPGPRYQPLYDEGSIKIALVPDTPTKQLLALLGRLFIKRKTLSHEITGYSLFIVYGEEVMGYFSQPDDMSHSLSCFCVFPPFARQGLGSLLIDFSYSRFIRDGADAEPQEITGPEGPLSKKAIHCFRKYWRYRVIGADTVRQISSAANISIDDAIIGLELNGFDFRAWRMAGPVAVDKPRLLSPDKFTKPH
ncbi:hypothetical protein PAPHI01_1734 [Pancytospora philotis]|nr:hypothetical protein PAPHI01_1734 [Pancytospora philotis]